MPDAPNRGRPKKLPPSSGTARLSLDLDDQAARKFEALSIREQWLVRGAFCYGLTPRALAELIGDGATEHAIAGELHEATFLLIAAPK